MPFNSSKTKSLCQSRHVLYFPVSCCSMRVDWDGYVSKVTLATVPYYVQCFHICHTIIYWEIIEADYLVLDEIELHCLILKSTPNMTKYLCLICLQTSIDFLYQQLLFPLLLKNNLGLINSAYIVSLTSKDRKLKCYNLQYNFHN